MLADIEGPHLDFICGEATAFHTALGGNHIFALLRQPPYVQKQKKSIPSYKINTLLYAFCFWLFIV